MTKLASQTEVHDLLKSLLDHEQVTGSDERLMPEWKVIQQYFSDLLEPHGSHGWDFNLMDWPTDVPIFNVSINQCHLKDAVPLEEVRALLATLQMPWCVRMECLDRIQDGIMVGGKELRDIVITKSRMDGWEA